MAERRHEWTDPETGAVCWLAFKRLEMDTRGEIDNEMGVFAHYAHHLASLLDTREAERDEARKEGADHTAKKHIEALHDVIDRLRVERDHAREGVESWKEKLRANPDEARRIIYERDAELGQTLRGLEDCSARVLELRKERDEARGLLAEGLVVDATVQSEIARLKAELEEEVQRRANVGVELESCRQEAKAEIARLTAKELAK